MAIFTLGDNQKVTLAVVGVDERENPSVTPTGPFTWVIEDPTLLELEEVSDDTRTAVVAAVGPLGKTSVMVWDGKLQGVGEISIVATEPVRLGFVAGTPQLISAPGEDYDPDY